MTSHSEINWDLAPSNVRGGLQRYIERGIQPGHFLTAVLENDLREACGRADDENRYLIFDIVKFIYNEVPSSAWGSTKNVQGWLEHFGLQGIEHHMARKLEQALEQLEEEDHD